MTAFVHTGEKMMADAIFNPHDKPVEELPFIFGFNNGGPPGWMSAVLIAENGVGLGGHLCSDEYYMRGDLGIIEGSRPDRHKGFQEHYPDGYRMAFVQHDDPRLLAAVELNRKTPVTQEPSP